MAGRTYGYAVKSSETFGLDPSVYRVHIGVHRHDVRALTGAEVEAIAEALMKVADFSPDPPLPVERRARPRRKHKAIEG